MATSLSDESSEEDHAGNLLTASDSQFLTEMGEYQISYSLAEDLKAGGFTEWEAVAKYPDPLLGAPISIVWHGLVSNRSATIDECVHEKQSGHRIYGWCTPDGFTGVITQEEIYQRHPDMRPLILTVTCFLDDGAIAVSGHRFSGEATPTIRIHAKKCFHAFVEMKNKFAETLSHNTHGLVLLTPEGGCLHDFDVFSHEFRAQQKALHEQQDSAFGAGSNSLKRHRE